MAGIGNRNIAKCLYKEYICTLLSLVLMFRENPWIHPGRKVRLCYIISWLYAKRIFGTNGYQLHTVSSPICHVSLQNTFVWDTMFPILIIISLQRSLITIHLVPGLLRYNLSLLPLSNYISGFLHHAITTASLYMAKPSQSAFCSSL